MYNNSNKSYATSATLSELIDSVLGALENERCLDLRFRANNKFLENYKWMPNYKVMKQIALRSRFRLLYPLLAVTFLISIPLVAIIGWIFSLLASLLYSPKKSGNIHILATNPLNIELIESALSSELNIGAYSVDNDLLSLRRLSAEIGFIGVCICIACHSILLLKILRFDVRKIVDLVFHSRDAMMMLMLVLYVRGHRNHRFVTEDHYQRWAFLLSNHSLNLTIVQHGMLDSKISFASSFGFIKTLYLRDLRSKKDFEKYYEIESIKTFLLARKFTSPPLSEPGIFLASSFPYIDLELKFAKAIKENHHIPLIVKFHPAHHYDERKQVLFKLADYICSDNEYPTCRLFVSYNSFMENDYVAINVPTFSIERQGDSSSTAQAVLNYLDTHNAN